MFVAAALVLVAGVVAGASIYFSVDDEPESTSYVVIGDTAYAVDPTRTKTYVMQLERFGGKAAVIFDDFNRWFAARWQGKALGVTIGWLGALVAAVLFAIGSKSR